MLQLLISIVELCKNLEQKVAKLEEKNKILEIENAELRERLGLNSRNSSLPSSKELYKIKNDYSNLKEIISSKVA